MFLQFDWHGNAIGVRHYCPARWLFVKSVLEIAMNGQKVPLRKGGFWKHTVSGMFVDNAGATHTIQAVVKPTWRRFWFCALYTTAIDDDAVHTAKGLTRGLAALVVGIPVGLLIGCAIGLAVFCSAFDMSPLHIAVDNGFMTAAQVFLCFGVNPDGHLDAEFSPLMSAAADGNLRMAELLLL